MFVIIVLNAYPLFISQDMMVETKKDKLMTRANYISSTLSVNEGLTEDAVSEIMNRHVFSTDERIIVCDETGYALYDSDSTASIKGKYILVAEVLSALSGLESFYADFEGNNFESQVSVPILTEGQISGAVYLYENDREQSEILQGMRNKLQWLSFFIALILLVLVIIFSNTLVRRLRTLLSGIRKMNEESYGDTVKPKGHDELTLIFDEFNNMSRRLQETEELRRTFVSDASHELRTPLSSIRLLTDSILQTPDMDIETVRDFMKDIGEEIDRLTRIAEKLLVLTRLDGAKKLELGPVNISDVVSMTLDTLVPIAEEGKISIRRDLSENLHILADSDGVHQIIFNLVENAIKYNKPGGYVHVLLFTHDNKCSLIVDDTGIGIPQEEYDKIFERFYRVDKARSRSGKGGSGLGLSIVRRNIENYGGTISIEPSPAGGTRFTVEFNLIEIGEEA